ncbi:MAG: hypothetical protein EG826_12320 [Deltaproteobacteria bacterium]|nr:hypothetical protein [Deltaproteobacteria bacterium]
MMAMQKPGTILKRLYDRLESSAKDQSISDLRLGLSYVGVQLDSGATGIAALLPDNTPAGCTLLKEAGTYAGSGVAKVLQYLVDGKNALTLAMGLAAANALIEPIEDKSEDREATTTFHLQPGEKVAMVGLFSPLVDRIRRTGAQLTIIEKNPERLDLLPAEDRLRALKECDIAIITATTLLNQTFEETMDALGSPRVAVLMGPSTPLAAEIFHDTPVTQLGGAVVTDSARVLQIISEGGGTPALRPYLRFVNVLL